MKYFAILVCAAMVSACEGARAVSLSQSASDTKVAMVQVMVLGTYHFAGSKSDLISIETDSVLTDRRQLELEKVIKSLATFRPTVVITERTTDAPEYRDKVFENFDKSMLAEIPNERVQLGYRLASAAGISRVYGLDERTSEGEPDYFPFDKVIEHAEKVGALDSIQTLLGEVQQAGKDAAIRRVSLPMSRVLYEVNTGPTSSPEFYYRLMAFDVGEDQPAAELHAYWFMRNAKIFSKLQDVTEPGNRMVIIYGAGHKFWLDHFTSQTPGFEKIDPAPYLLTDD